MTRPLVYVAGPYTAPTPEGIQGNIRRAQVAGVELRLAGAEALVPHALSLMVEGLLPESEWVESGLRHLARCDAVLVLRGWRESRGTLGELEAAWWELGLPVFGERAPGSEGLALPDSLLAWIRSWGAK